jgi:hypothetical protein
MSRCTSLFLISITFIVFNLMYTTSHATPLPAGALITEASPLTNVMSDDLVQQYKKKNHSFS